MADLALQKQNETADSDIETPQPQPKTAAKQEAEGKAGDAALGRIEHEGGFPEAGEKAGDRGALNQDLSVQIDGKDVVLPAGTLVSVKEVITPGFFARLTGGGGTKLKVSLSGKYAGKEITIPVSAFKQGGGGGKAEDKDGLDPLQDPAKNPDPKNEYAPNATYGEVKGAVAVKGEGEAHAVDPSDVEQGALGDCYFVAKLASQAKTNPDRIANLIKDNGDGTYTVTLHLKQGGKRVATPIVVDSQFPQKDGGVAYAKPGDSGELWPMLIEKAFAKYSGSYELIRGSKTKDGDVFAMMSGVESATYSPASLGGDKLLEKVGKALANGQACSFGAKSKSSADEKLQEEAEAAGVVLNHAYSVLATDAKARTISLRNPWGVKHLLDFSVDSIVKYYDSVNIAREMSVRALPFGLIAILGGCSPALAKPADTRPPTQESKKPMPEARTVRIEETTVGTIDGWKVTVGNVMKGKWKLPDGTERQGISAEVGLYDEKKAGGETTVGEGAVLRIAGKPWTVVKVASGSGGGANGSIELRQQ